MFNLKGMKHESIFEKYMNTFTIQNYTENY